VGARFDPGDPDPGIPAPTTNFRTPAERVVHIEELKPQISSLDIGTLNFGGTVFVNTEKHITEIARRIRRANVKPELEVFDLGHLRQAVHLVEQDLFDAPPLFQLCLGIPWGAPATVDALMSMQRHLPPNALWSAFGISNNQRPIAALSVVLGGHVRVGLEDNLYLERGVLAPGNAALVQQAVAIIDSLGHKVATPASARELFHIH
ncbi:MAG: 3-keto-5-aminohexanoate cleavage protein, partial [Pseudomonadota bacterium]